LGATLQYSGMDLKKKVVVNAPVSDSKQISGFDLLSNNQVSGLCTYFSNAFFAWASSFFFLQSFLFLFFATETQLLALLAID
jgi:hypothetical protein